MLLQILMIILQGVMLRKKPCLHIFLSLPPAPGRHFLLAGRSGTPCLLLGKRHLGQGKGIPGIFHGKTLGSQLIVAVHKQGYSRQAVTPLGLLCQNPLHGNMGNIVGKLQCFLNFPVGYHLVRQHCLNQCLHKNSFPGTIFQQQNTIVAVKAKS